ncbi:hypothetical protein FHR19_002920 [Sphingomonas yantingensis]|uniref:Uncharacterized protein n=1 Tax=Sphingomonas yantingensis TaxID=1241761 RepID=A0A7W9EIV1_9SPHN|nr:hypothetical protein [Sphingomonas yantingensis]
MSPRALGAIGVAATVWLLLRPTRLGDGTLKRNPPPAD